MEAGIGEAIAQSTATDIMEACTPKLLELVRRLQLSGGQADDLVLTVADCLVIAMVRTGEMAKDVITTVDQERRQP